MCCFAFRCCFVRGKQKRKIFIASTTEKTFSHLFLWFFFFFFCDISVFFFCSRFPLLCFVLSRLRWHCFNVEKAGKIIHHILAHSQTLRQTNFSSLRLVGRDVHRKFWILHVFRYLAFVSVLFLLNLLPSNINDMHEWKKKKCLLPLNIKDDH